jgi:two-component system, NarL family, sensor histidine kinase UhpB
MRWLRLFALEMCLLAGLWASCQTHKTDSMLAVLNKPISDTARINTLNTISAEFLNQFEEEQAMNYAKQALALSEKLGFQKGIAMAHFTVGNVYWSINQTENARKEFSTALKIYTTIKDTAHIARTFFLMAHTHMIDDNYGDALEKMYSSIRYYELLGNEASSSEVYSMMGLAQLCLQDTAAALIGFNKSQEIFKKHGGSETGYANTCLYLGEINFIRGYYKSAKEYYEKSLYYYHKDQSEEGVIDAETKIATLYEVLAQQAFVKGDTTAARYLNDTTEQKYLDALIKYKKLNLNQGISQVSYLLGNFYMKQKKLHLSRNYHKQSLMAAQAINGRFLMRDAYLGLSGLDKLEGNYQAAFYNLSQYKLYNDSLVSEESIRKSAANKMRYETEKREDQIKLLSTENKLNTVLAQKESQRKNFAFAGIAIVLLGGSYGFYWFRKKKRLQNQQALMNERLRISRELHDEVGATLSGVSMYSHLTKTQLQSSDLAGVENSLNVMQESSAQMVNKLNDIVWLMNPDQDSLQKLIQRLEEYARNMASVKNMEVKIHIPLHLNEHLLPIEKRRNIYLFCKEAINNAVKYSGGTMLELSITEKENKLEFKVSDDGKGFDAEIVRRGNGLNNLRQRAEEMNANYIVQSVPGQGTVLILKFKV